MTRVKNIARLAGVLGALWTVAAACLEDVLGLLGGIPCC